MTTCTDGPTGSTHEKSIFLVLFAGITASVALAVDIVVEMKQIDTTGVGAPLGKITITASSDGVRLVPDLNSLPPGSHGFHLHENGSCLPGEKDASRRAAPRVTITIRLRPASMKVRTVTAIWEFSRFSRWMNAAHRP